ncbi:MAG TPA: Na+/H+ antiporter [Candidatus Acidoferrales bacterium]|nr:Na+/H+ antiporter [Candidatus Acidoferrales bacterium]
MTETQIELVVGLLVVTIPLVALARRSQIAYPIVLVLGGLALGFVPGLPAVQLEPNLVLLLFLPPLLYWEAITAPTDVMIANGTQIGMLAIGLVLATTVAVAAGAHAVIPHLPWAAAFVLGAIVAPTDELASAPVLERFQIPRHVIAIVEGESLLNDALSLVIYAAAVTALVTGVFSFGRAVLDLVAGAFASVIIGVIIGRIAVEGWRRVSDTDLQTVISLILPFLSYIPALLLGISGVLEVVTTGVYVNRFTPVVLTPESRLRLVGFWQTFVFIANALLFLLLGVQLHAIATGVFARHPWQMVVASTAAVNLIVIVVRFAWIIGMEFIPNVGGSSEHADPDWKHAMVAAWSGLRGAVSLAAALAIPTTIAGGLAFPDRDLIIFLTFTVIVVTLVGGGLTLPILVTRLNISESSEEEEREMRRALAGASKAALDCIQRLEEAKELDPDYAQILRHRYDDLRQRSRQSADSSTRERNRRRAKAEHEIIEAQRQALTAMREGGEIDNTVLRNVMLALDLAEARRFHKE